MLRQQTVPVTQIQFLAGKRPDTRIDQASWGGYIRHNQLWREVYDLSGALLEEQYLCTNDAIMMYSPLLSAAPADGE